MKKIILSFITIIALAILFLIGAATEITALAVIAGVMALVWLGCIAVANWRWE